MSILSCAQHRTSFPLKLHLAIILRIQMFLYDISVSDYLALISHLLIIVEWIQMLFNLPVFSHMNTQRSLS